MNLRRVTLVVAMALLAFCAASTAAAAGLGNSELLGALISTAIAVLVAAALVFSLTFIVDRPKYRAGGIAAIILVVLLLVDLGGLFLAESFERSAPTWVAEDALVGGLALLSMYGIPTVFGLMAAQFEWARRAAIFLALIAAASICIAAAGGLLGILSGRGSYGPDDLVQSSLALYGTAFVISLLLVNSGCGDRRLFRWPAVAAAAFAACLYVAGIWAGDPQSTDALAQTATIMLLPAVFLAHLNLLLMRKTGGARILLQGGAAAASALCCVFCGMAVRSDGGASDWLVSWMFASGVLSVCLSLGLIATSLMRKRFDYREEKIAETLTHMQIVCPRCEKAQRVALGDSACGGCGLKFSIKAMEPRCAECGYLLYGITSPRCPECGAAVAGGDLSETRPSGSVEWRDLPQNAS